MDATTTQVMSPEPVSASAANPDLDPYNPAALRLRSDFLAGGGVKTILTHVPVRKPHKQEFVRVHPDLDYRIPVMIVEVQPTREMYLVSASFADAMVDEAAPYMVYTAVTRQGTTFLWPCRLPSPDGKPMAWHTTAIEAAEYAMKNWTRVRSNMDLGAYQISAPLVELSSPVWPRQSFTELLQMAFRNRVIDSMDHPIVKQLRGAE
jgi:hypothetical protein